MLQIQVWILIWTATALLAKEGPRCPLSIAPERCREDGAPLDEFFFVINGERMIILYKAKYLHITCSANITLENEEMPRFRTAVEVPLVKLTACPPPSVPYADALGALNVTPGAVLELAQTPPVPVLRAEHLRGLRVSVLTLSGAAPLAPSATLLQALPALRDLRLFDVALPPAAAAHLPRGLRALSLQRASLAAGLPAAALARAPALRRLNIRDPTLAALDLSAAPALADATVEAPLTELVLGPALANLSLTGARRVAMAGACVTLRRLAVERAAPPDAAWLAGCAELQALVVRLCKLSELPTQWLEDAPALLSLDLSDNNLEVLPGEMISLAKQLEELNLSNNRLRRQAVEVVAALPRLADLTLAHNPLGDICGGGASVQSNGQSPLWSARALRHLSLADTGATRVCRDWRALRALRTLDLRANDVARLDAADLQWARALPATVDLRGNPLRTVHYAHADYTAAMAAPARADAPVTLLMDARLRCDCGEYWYARAVRDAPQHAATLITARCDEGALAGRDPRSLLCAAPAGACPRGCSCGANELTELRCAGGALQAVPAVPALPAPRVLLLAHNNITRIGPEVITPQLEILDLTDNQIADIDVETASALAAAPRLELRLAGNPLRCDCAALPALRLLAAQASPVHVIRCATGEPLRAAAARLQAACAPPLWPLALAALVLCAVSAGAAAALGRHAARRRIKRFLFERGLCARWLLRGDERGDSRCDRDVFLSYAQGDARAAAELTANLERGGRRVLLHERDWTPGELIPAQIAASVSRSRRTLVLLSEHFLASSWARAELREAYGAALAARRPRLLLVLLPGLEPARAAAADAHLRAYIARVTYLRWDDPRFWQRLERALPPPLQALQGPVPAPAPAAA